MIDTWKKQFTIRQLSLVHKTPLTFIICQWQRNRQSGNIFYLIYRWLIALIFFTTFVISIIDLKHPNSSSSYRAKWLIYLTNWGYTMCTLQSLMGATILSIYLLSPYLRSMPNLQCNVLKCYQTYWLFNIIATDIAFGITILYWSIIYNAKTMALDTMNIFVHANNSILMMIDLFMVSHPVKLLHCCYPVIFGVAYAIFSVIFYAAGGISREGHRYIYTILNWAEPETILVCVGVTVFIVIVHLFTWTMQTFRQWLFRRFMIKPDDSNSKNDQGVINNVIKNI